MFETLVVLVSLLAGGVAAISGFGIGSLLTPLLSLPLGTKLAVALVSIPHLVATSIRFWMLRSHIDKKIFLNFGIMSAIGGLLGALLNAAFGTPALTLIFGCILVFSGFLGATGISERLRFQGPIAWVAGGLSGILGGMVGNQGGIRSAALLGFNVSKKTFVATATAIALLVDLSRMPIYLWHQSDLIFKQPHWIFLTTVGVVLGTFLGAKVLKRLNERTFKQVVSSIILLLGTFMIYQGLTLFR